MRPERLQEHHKIWKCIGKVFPKSKELRATIHSPGNIQLVTPRQHKELHTDTNEVFQYLLHEFKGKRIKETVIPREEVVFERLRNKG
jgi:hypothetical protein